MIYTQGVNGAWYAEALPGPARAYAALIPRSHIETHLGDVALPGSESVLYLRCYDFNGVFWLAGQGAVTDTAWLWNGSAWVNYGPTPGVNTCAFGAGCLYVVKSGSTYLRVNLLTGASSIEQAALGSQGFRFIRDDGVPVPADDTHRSADGTLFDYTERGDVTVGQGPVQDTVAIFGAARERMTLVHAVVVEDCRFVRVNRTGDEFAVATVMDLEAPRRAVLQWFTRANMRADVSGPMTIAPFNHPVLILPFKDPTGASGVAGIEANEIGRYTEEADPATAVFFAGNRRVLAAHDSPAPWTIPLVLRPWDIPLVELYRLKTETLEQSVARWRGLVESMLLQWPWDCGVIPQFYCQGGAPPNELWTVPEVLDGLNYLSPLVNLSPRIKIVAPFAWERLNGITAHPELRAAFESLKRATPGRPILIEVANSEPQPIMTTPIIEGTIYDPAIQAGVFWNLTFTDVASGTRYSVSKDIDDHLWIVGRDRDGRVGKTGIVRPLRVVGASVPPPTPDPEPIPEPTPAPVDPWETMVRDTIRAVFSEDGRPVPTQEQEDAIFARCYPRPRGEGWTDVEIRAYVQGLDRRNAIGTLTIDGRFFQMDGAPFTIIESSEFSLYKRYLDGEDITPILRDRAGVGFNTLRVWLLNQSVIGGRNGGFDGSRIHPADYPNFYEALLPFVTLCGQHGQVVELTVFTSTGALMPNREDQQRHLDRTADVVRGLPNVLLELANEIDQYDNAPHSDLRRPSGVLISRGSNGADSTPPRHDAPWDYELYHTNDLSEFQRKVGHNAMEWADQSGKPCVSNENTRYPDKDSSTTHAYDAAAGGALLCAGSCFHSQGGKFSTLFGTNRERDSVGNPLPSELECAQAWVAGARRVPLEFQRGAYARHDDRNGPNVIRSYSRTLPDGRQYLIDIRP